MEQLEQFIVYITKLCQSNFVLGIVLCAGVFLVLICIAVVDRKIGYMRRQLDAIMQHYGLEALPEPPREKIKWEKKSAKKSEPKTAEPVKAEVPAGTKGNPSA